MTTPNGSAADELRAYYGCRELESVGLRAVPAFDEQGRPTGLVAIDPAELRDWFDDGAAFFEIADAEDDEDTDDCEGED
ncbi:hypothetical protein [Kribbella sp. NPDC006257]|uniref:hypothetical protein n=1 Tax=Kribbella sp. NPDC006257 TaxID=3156738 RepID=UPI0033B50249